MSPEETQDRKIQFSQVLDGVDDAFFEWAAHRFFNESKMRQITLPWSGTTIQAQSVSVKVDSKATTELKTTFKKLADLDEKFKGVSWKKLNIKPPYANPTWVKITEAPIVKKKAYNLLGMHITKGMHIQTSIGSEGVVTGCTKYLVKYKSLLTGLLTSIPYANVKYVNLNTLVTK